MFENLKHKRQTFSYTRLDDDEFDLRPLFLKISEELAFIKVEAMVKKMKAIEKKVDKIHHEIFVKEEDVEITYLFTTSEKMHAIISVTTYANKKGISYNRLLQELAKLKELFKMFLVKEE